MTLIDPISAPSDRSTLAIAGVTESVVFQYFETLNAADFIATSNLFAEDGGLHPPLDEVIVGREAIVQYLLQEAKGMKVQPRQGVEEPLEDGCRRIQVTGKVQMPLFGVNVSWVFIVSPAGKILLAQVKLLASPQELLKLRRSGS